MSVFSGRQGKGAMRRHRDTKRAEAVARNAVSFAGRHVCGHIHGEAFARFCGGAR